MECNCVIVVALGLIAIKIIKYSVHNEKGIIVNSTIHEMLLSVEITVSSALLQGVYPTT